MMVRITTTTIQGEFFFFFSMGGLESVDWIALLWTFAKETAPLIIWREHQMKPLTVVLGLRSSCYLALFGSNRSVTRVNGYDTCKDDWGEEVGEYVLDSGVLYWILVLFVLRCSGNGNGDGNGIGIISGSGHRLLSFPPSHLT